MRVGFNARLLADPSIRGWNRYTLNLLVELGELGVELVLLTDQPLHESHTSRLAGASFSECQSPPGLRYLEWEQGWLPRQCKAERLDILHCPFNFGLPFQTHCPRVLTLHDAIDQGRDKARSLRDRFSKARILSDLHHHIARTRANMIITVSEHAKSDIIRRLGTPRERIAVTPEAADRVFHEPISEAKRSEVRARFEISGPYFFYIGGWEGRKNIETLVRGYAESGVAGAGLVLAGGKAAERERLTRLAAELGVSGRLKLLGWVDDADLPALYAEALAFVYPSRYEGFGLQICEAMAVGCPVLSSNATSLPEVLGEGGALFSPDDPGELADLIRRVAVDQAFRQDLIDRGRRRSRDFSWKLTAERTLAVYRGLCQTQ